MIEIDPTVVIDYSTGTVRKVDDVDRYGLLESGRKLSESLREVLGLLLDRHSVPAPPMASILSLRQAAAKLRVDRNTTLKRLIHSGQLKTVTVNGQTKVAAAEVERLAAVGFETRCGHSVKAQRRRERKHTTAGAGMRAAILAIKV